MNRSFTSVAKYMVAIWAEEDSRGIPRSEPDFRMKVLEARWQELKKLASVSKPAAPVSVATPAATPAPKVYLPQPTPKPVAIEQPKLTGMAAVRASIRKDIEASNLIHEPTLHRLLPAATTTARPTRKQCEAIYIVVQPSAGPMPDSWSDDQVFAEVTRAAFQAHQRIIGMPSDETLSNEYWRTEKPTGLARAVAAQRRYSIEAILKAK